LYKKYKENPEKKFLVSEEGKELTYSQTIREIQGIASRIAPGDNVVHFMYNSIESILSYLAVLWAGGKIIAIDPLTSAEDLAFILADANPDLIITDEDLLKREKEFLRGYRVLVNVERNYINSQPYEYREEEVGLIYYYAGIAGRTMQVLHSAKRVELNSAILYRATRLNEVRSLLTVPLAHVLGNSILGVTIESGGTMIIMKKFDVNNAINIINKYKINYLSTVPLVYDYLNSVKEANLETLQLCISSAAPLSQITVKTFKEKYRKNIVQQYGFTEGLVVTFQPQEYADFLSIGKPLEGVEIRIVKDNGRDANVGEVGELWIKAPWLMLGYKDPKETAKVFSDGWLKTGDLVSIDENGLLYFKGVKKRMLKFKGYPIFPRDLEEILKSHPNVIDALVVGEDEGNLGQRPVAKVVVKEKIPEIDKLLLEYVNSKVALYKRLKRVDVVEKIEYR
jgi:long-chain acyl-CoA synthetase